MVYLVKIMKDFKTNYKWGPFTSYRDIAYTPLGYIAKFINSNNKKVLQILKEYKLKNECNIAMVYSKYKPIMYTYIRTLCQYGYIRRYFPLCFKSHDARRPISYYRKRDVNDS